MPFAEIFKGLLGGDPVKSIGDLIGQFSPIATQELEVRRDEIEAARDEALAQIQSQNITAETKSEDPYVRRARPTFLYVIIAAMAYSLIVAPTINACLHRGLVAMQIPNAYSNYSGWLSSVIPGRGPGKRRRD